MGVAAALVLGLASPASPADRSRPPSLGADLRGLAAESSFRELALGWLAGAGAPDAPRQAAQTSAHAQVQVAAAAAAAPEIRLRGSTQAVTAATATGVTIDVPSGPSTGDILLAQIAIAPAPSVAAVSPPLGWDLVPGLTGRDTAWGALHLVYWKPANGEPAGYTWNWTGARTAVGG